MAQNLRTISSASSRCMMHIDHCGHHRRQAGVLFRAQELSDLKRLEAIAKKHDILLIADEMITGFCRLGVPFGSDYFGISPDIITTAKA